MEDRNEETYNQRCADVYDQWFGYFDETGSRLFPVEVRYAWPPELDLMAQLAGLRLQARWGDWRRGEFNAQSEKHVSVYERPA